MGISPGHWLPWIPQLLTCLVRREGTHILNLLCSVGKAYPQAVYFPIRTLYLTLKMEQREKREIRVCSFTYLYKTTLCELIPSAVKADQQSKASTPSNSTERSLAPPTTSSDPTPSSQGEPMDTSGGGLSQLKIHPGGMTIQGATEATAAQVGLLLM